MRLPGAGGLALRVLGCLLASVGAMVPLPATTVDAESATSGPVVAIDPHDTSAQIAVKAANVVPTARQKTWQQEELTAFVHTGAGDVDRLMSALRDAGFHKVMFEAKEIGTFVESARRFGLAIGFDLLGADPSTLHDLLTRYGVVDEVRLDPAKVQIVRALQPNAMIDGVDMRRVNEGASDFSAVSFKGNAIGAADRSTVAVVDTGDFLKWSPAECGASLDSDSLVDTYFNTVGRNCQLLLDVPTNADVARLHDFGAKIAAMFADNLTRSVSHEADGSVVADLGGTKTVGIVAVQESQDVGQRITEFEVQSWNGCAWTTVASGTTVGYKRLIRLPNPVTTSKIRLHPTSTRATPTITTLALYH